MSNKISQLKKQNVSTIFIAYFQHCLGCECITLCKCFFVKNIPYGVKEFLQPVTKFKVQT